MKDMILMKMEPDLESDSEESQLQQNGNMDNVFTVHIKEEVVECLKEEAAWEDSAAVGEAAALASLYAGHEVKEELVLGPEGLQPRDVAFTLYAHAHCGPESVKVEVEHSLGYESHVIETTTEAGFEELINTPPGPCVPSSPKRAEAPTSAAPREPRPSAPPNHQHNHHTLHYICYICKKHYTESNALKRHMRTHTGENLYICDTCNKSFTEKNALKTHIRNIHGQKPFVNCAKESKSISSKKCIHRETYSCDRCGTVFTEHIAFLRHQRTHRQFPCAVCKRQFSQMEHLRSHELIHKDVKPFSCYICKEQFMTSQQLLAHSRDHTAPAKQGTGTHRKGPRKCKTCNEEFQLRSALILHERTHAGENFFCKICNKKFLRVFYLRAHEKEHFTAKSERNVCGICNKGFKKTYGLKNHIRVHTGERPFSCNVCDKAFKLSDHLRRHRLTHTGEKPYLCDICGKRFNHKCALVVHRQTHDEKRKLNNYANHLDKGKEV